MSDPSAEIEQGGGFVLLSAIFVLAICGLVYELIAGTLSSYLLGDPVSHFSLVIGMFLTAMGVGSWLSRFVKRHLLDAFVAIEVAIGLIGGFTALVGFALFTFTDAYLPGLFMLVLTLGALIGMEIPIVVRVLREQGSLRITMANVMSVDYVGALAAAVAFPFLLLPHLGLVHAGLVMGLLNVLVAALVLWRLSARLHARRTLTAVTSISTVLLAGGLVSAGGLVTHMESRLYQDEVILARTTPHQRLVVTRWRNDIRLYLSGQLQFSSVDEYRYHEPLVHPALSLAERRQKVLILGGGDGLAARQVLAYADVARVTIVDLDPVVTTLFREHTLLKELNGRALSDPRVTIVNADAMQFLQAEADLYDVILMDLPDPDGPTIAKLYSKPWFRLAKRRLARGGMLATQATSPYRSRSAFWCIVHTMRAAGLEATPLHSYVPTFGVWGFVLASHTKPRSDSIELRVKTRFLTKDVVRSLFVLPPDIGEVETPINELNNPILSRLYRDGYKEHFD